MAVGAGGSVGDAYARNARGPILPEYVREIPIAGGGVQQEIAAERSAAGGSPARPGSIVSVVGDCAPKRGGAIDRGGEGTAARIRLHLAFHWRKRGPRRRRRARSGGYGPSRPVFAARPGFSRACASSYRPRGSGGRTSCDATGSSASERYRRWPCWWGSTCSSRSSRSAAWPPRTRCCGGSRLRAGAPPERGAELRRAPPGCRARRPSRGRDRSARPAPQGWRRAPSPARSAGRAPGGPRPTARAHRPARWRRRP